nr:F-box containing protein [Marseillevirus futianmevirus]
MFEGAFSGFSFTSKTMEFQDFSLEVVSHIVSFLCSVKHINSFAQTCSVYHQLVREQDMRFVCREYGKVPGPTEKRGTFHVSPTGVLHGPCCTSHEGGVVASTYSHGVLSGFQMTFYGNGYVESGMYKDGERVGLWKNDSAGFREDWNGDSRRVFYNEDGSSHSHSKGDGGDVIFSYDKNDKILSMYREEMMDEEFYCENSNITFCAGYVEYLPEEYGFSKTKKRFFHCCKEHQGDMPDDLLYFEEPDGFLREKNRE